MRKLIFLIFLVLTYGCDDTTTPSEYLKPPTFSIDISTLETSHIPVEAVRKCITKDLHIPIDSKNLFFSDTTYIPYTIAELREFLKQDNTNSLLYQDNFFDCDNFAYTLQGRVSERFHGIMFGIIWYWKSPTVKHAANVFLDWETQVTYMVEPQDDTTTKAEQTFVVVMMMNPLRGTNVTR